MKLSVIIPYALEYPQNVFTIRQIASSLEGKIDFEIIAVDNYCSELEEQQKTKGLKVVNDKTFDQLKEVSRSHKWLKPIKYTEKLSCWQARGLGIQHSTGNIIYLVDAHCIVDGLAEMALWYDQHKEELNGTLHTPLTYQIMEYRKLIYKLKTDIDKGVVHYTFSTFKSSQNPYEVPCMSSCGMMIDKDIIVNNLGNFPSELGIYGGGENFLNFTLAIIGKKKWIYPKATCYHHGAPRKYSFNYNDHKRNQGIAAYLHSGAEFCRLFLQNCKGSAHTLNKIYDSIVNNQKLVQHRKLIQQQQKVSIEDWLDTWENQKIFPQFIGQ